MPVLAPIAERAAAPVTLPLPPADLGLHWRPLAPPDAPAILALVQATEEVDDPPYRQTLDEVEELFEGSWRDASTDTLGGFDADGVLRAGGFAETRPGDQRTVRSFLTGYVHPQWRGRGVGRALVAWLDGRGRQLLAASGKDVPGRLAVHLADNVPEHAHVWERAGYRPYRWYAYMKRDLALPIPQVELPAGLRLTAWTEELDEEVRLAHNEAFLDHWGSEPATPESWRQGRQHFAPTWSFVVLDETGPTPEVAGYTLAGRYEQDWPAIGFTCGCSDLLGVRRPWRGNGLAVALLAASMEAFRADGMDAATIGVDTDNPTGAFGLYTRLGYVKLSGETAYTIEL